MADSRSRFSDPSDDALDAGTFDAPGRIEFGAMPRYAQIAVSLRRKILERRELGPGDRLPSESELARSYQVSRLTLRQALSVLQEEGLIDRRHGLGTFVRAHNYQRAATRLTGLYEDLEAAGCSQKTSVIELSLVNPPLFVASSLELPAETECYRIERVRLAADQPVARMISYVVAALVPNLERTRLEAESLYAIFERDYALNLDYAQQKLEAVAADAKTSELLHVDRGSPVLRIRRRTWLVSGAPIEYVTSYYRGDAISYTHTLQRHTPVHTVVHGISGFITNAPQ